MCLLPKRKLVKISFTDRADIRTLLREPTPFERFKVAESWKLWSNLPLLQQSPTWQQSSVKILHISYNIRIPNPKSFEPELVNNVLHLFMFEDYLC